MIRYIKKFFDYLNRKNIMLICGLFFSLLFILIAIFAEHFELHNPTEMNLANALTAPCKTYPFGTDQLGRDIFSRIIEGSRISLGTAFAVVIIAAAIGTAIGAVSGYFGGAMDMILMRIVDIFLAFPTIIFVLALSTFMRGNQANLIIALCCVQWVRYARIARGEAVILHNAEFVEAAKGLGAGNLTILFKYFIPNLAPKILITMSMDIGGIILYCASLSFLGLGAQPPSPAWGTMISDGKGYLRSAWWMTVYPGLAVSLTALSFNMIGDGLRDLLDPRMRESVSTE